MGVVILLVIGSSVFKEPGQNEVIVLDSVQIDIRFFHVAVTYEQSTVAVCLRVGIIRSTVFFVDPGQGVGDPNGLCCPLKEAWYPT